MAITARTASPLDDDAGLAHAPQPTMTLTKRDVRRNRMAEKLGAMIRHFNDHQHSHYRAQLQALQVDMTMILRADPYSDGPLEDDGAAIRRLVEEMAGSGLPAHEAAQRDFHALAGKRYGDFARGVNDALEGRDSDLTGLHDHFYASLAELHRHTQQKLHQAEEEHQALTSTIRQRLVATLAKKRQGLQREKEGLDISDTNALLMHPSQCSINAPASPPNGLQVRKTRHLRHRAVSPGADEAARRKRKAEAMDDGNDSPTPATRLPPPPDFLGGGRSPFKDARAKEEYKQYQAPAYSLERLFTDKELALATDTAKVATYRYFHQASPPNAQSQALGQPESNGQTNGHPSAVPSVGEEMLEAADNALALLAVNDLVTERGRSTTPAAAPEMERTTSHQNQVLTRGSARANPLAALSDLASAAATVGANTANGGMSALAALAGAAAGAARENPFAPVVPSFHAVTRSEKSGAPAPTGVSSIDIENDFEMMRRAANPSASSNQSAMDLDDEEAAASGEAMRRQLLDQALGVSASSQPYRLPVVDTGPAIIGRGVDRVVGTGWAPVPSMLEQCLRLANLAARGEAGGGDGGFGAEAAGRVVGSAGFMAGGNGSMAAALQGRLGGEPMSRATSAGGSEQGEARRGKGRLG